MESISCDCGEVGPMPGIDYVKESLSDPAVDSLMLNCGSERMSCGSDALVVNSNRMGLRANEEDLSDRSDFAMREYLLIS